MYITKNKVINLPKQKKNFRKEINWNNKERSWLYDRNLLYA